MRERDERFIWSQAVARVGLQDTQHSLRAVLDFDVAGELPRDGGIWTKAAANVNVKTIDRVFAIWRYRYFAGDETNVANVVLGTGMVAAGQVNVDRAIERNARLNISRDGLGCAFGIGRREFAAWGPRASNQSGADAGCLGR